MTDFATLMPDVAKALMGEPNPKLSKGDRWRYGNKGSLGVDAAKGQWYDFEADTGGGVLKFIQHALQTDRRGALDWLRCGGYISEPSPRRNVGRSDARSARTTRQYRTMPNRTRAAQKPRHDKEKSDTDTFAKKLWARAEQIGDNADHPFRAWARVRNLLHPWCAVPGGIRWQRYRGGAVVAGVFPLNAWGTDGIPKGEPVAVQLVAIDRNGENRYCLGENKDLRRCSYGPVSAGVFMIGDPTSERVNICEGVADALAVYSRKPDAVLATLGTGASLGNKTDVIDWLCTKETRLYPDNDNAGDRGTTALAEAIKSKNPDARVFAIEAEAFDDPGQWAEQTPLPEIERYDFDEKSGIFFDSGWAWGEADRMAVQTLNGER